MKRTILSLAVIIMLIASVAFSVSAEAFVYEEISMDIPGDAVLAPDDVAEFYDTTKLWMTDGTGFIMYLDVGVNDDNYVCADYSQRDFQSFFEGYVEATDFEQYATLKNAENITAGSMEGIRLDMYYDDGEYAYTHTLCGFATEEKTYTFYFDVSDEQYAGYVDSIIDSLSIDGTAFKGKWEINPTAIARIIIFVIVVPIVNFFRKKKEQKKSAQKTAEASVVQTPTENSVIEDTSVTYNNTEITAVDNNCYSEASVGSFAAKEAERERKEREKMFD